MTLESVELEFRAGGGLRPASMGKARVVAAKFDCGCEWRLIGEGVLRVTCRVHAD